MCDAYRKGRLRFGGGYGSTVMVVGILHNELKSESLHYVDLISDLIKRYSGTSDGDKWTVTDERSTSVGDIIENADMIISVGGDGTFLKAASLAIRRDIPMFGFNLGTLGLLTEFESDDPAKCIKRLINGEYIVEERPVRLVRIYDRSDNTVFEEYALNDCVLERGALSGVAYISLSISGSFVDIYPCNGIVVATQTGSTAYSMSAGGPIIAPGNDVVVVTPICSHCTDGRPIVARSDSDIEMHLCKNHSDMFVNVDGHKHYKIDNEHRILCSRADTSLKVIRIDPPDFYEALRRKAYERRVRLEGSAEE